jgi:hypothetical protein
MRKDKFDFINDILAERNLENDLKERFFKLVSKELELGLSSFREIEYRITQLENNINRSLPPGTEELNSGTGVKAKPKKGLPRPKQTSDVLSWFRDASKQLKVLTHDFNIPTEPITYDQLLISIEKEIEELKANYPNAKDYFLNHINRFALEKDPVWYYGFGTNRVTMNTGWSTTSFKAWYLKEYALWQEDNTRRIHPINDSYWNANLIEPFRKTYEIKDNSLTEIFNEVIAQIFSANDLLVFDIHIDKSLEFARHLLDVNALAESLLIMLRLIREKGYQHKRFRIEVNYRSNFLNWQSAIVICHIDSDSKIPILNNPNLIGGEFSSIQKQLWSVCNWYIEANFNGVGYRKYLLDDSKSKDVKLENAVEGFTHYILLY